MNSLQVLPFYNLNDQEFNLVNGIRSVQFSQLMDTDMFNLISNPDKSDEIDPDLMLTILLLKLGQRPFQCFTVM